MHSSTKRGPQPVTDWSHQEQNQSTAKELQSRKEGKT